jgi:hypothetical protein
MLFVNPLVCLQPNLQYHHFCTHTTELTTEATERGTLFSTSFPV